MQILQFIIKYWDSILLVVLVLGFVIYLIKTGQTKVLKQIAIKLVTEAEGEYGSGTGIVKKSAVVSWLYNHLPAILKFIFTEKDLENIVETVLEEAKKKWEANENLSTYIENKKQATEAITLLGIADEIKTAEPEKKE
ncbi:MAG: hypothetical protein PHR62_02475 [Paludibacter sp.]|nr:hypothetical protein [Paludibacter sp.]